MASPIDPVQSIRVASNLAERFGALITPGTMAASELELKIGEAQQLYPEIWRHLDDARTALVGQGRDVSVFDHMRRDELAHLGVTDIEVSEHLDYMSLMVGRLRTAQVKTATFNVAGYRRALEACRALMAAMPEIDWKALAREEEREIRAAGSLQTAKWFGIAKLIVIAAALLGVAVLIYRLVWNVEEELPPPVTRKPARSEPTEADRRAMQDRWDRIATYEKVYAATCDRAVRTQLAAMLRDADQVTRASQVETAQCVPVRPTCDDVKAAIGARLRESFHLLEDKSWNMTCQGIMMLRGAGIEPGLAVVLSARDTEGRIQTLRGVTSIDGTRDSVTFGSAPGTRLAGIGDLDGDSSEELVFVDTTSLTVSSIKGPGFVDVEGPAMPSGCSADANIEGDFRNGRKGERKYLVLTVPDDVKRKQCLSPGRHFYALRDGELAETD